MAERAWFVASGGRQEGPFSETDFRSDIAAGRITPDTMVWTDGMADWQRAGDVPGLLSRPGRPPMPPNSGQALARDGGPGQPVTVELGLWGLLGRTLVYLIGMLLVIPAPWVATSFYGWLIAQLRIPRRGSAAFTGQPMDIWYVLVGLALCSYISFAGYFYVAIPLQAFLSWLLLKWIVANISLEGREPRLSFTGNVWAYIGWFVLLNVSVITIIGWAWVMTAWMRWTCANIAGTRRTILFVASGWQMLWRSFVFSFACCFIIPIPWVLRWYVSWYVAQFVLADRTA